MTNATTTPTTRTPNTGAVIERGDSFTFTPRYATQEVEGIVVEVRRFAHIAAGSFTVIADGRRFGFELIGHNGRRAKGCEANALIAELLEARRLVREHPAQPVWSAALERFEAEHGAELRALGFTVPAPATPEPSPEDEEDAPICELCGANGARVELVWDDQTDTIRCADGCAVSPTC